MIGNLLYINHMVDLAYRFWPWLVGLPTKFPDIYPKWSQNFPLHCIHLLWSAGKGQFTCLNRNLQGLGIGLVCLSYILCYENVYDSKRPPPLEAPDRSLRCVGGTLHCDGMFDAYVRRRDTVYKFRVAVIPESPCLLGRSVSEQMGLVQRMDSLECPTASRKMHMRTDEVNISLKEGHTLYCAVTLSEMAIPLMEPCRRELEWMEANGIIEKVTEPTDWCARMVPVPKKSGEVRICVDLKCLNRMPWTLSTIHPRGHCPQVSRFDGVLLTPRSQWILANTPQRAEPETDHFHNPVQKIHVQTATIRDKLG